MATIFTKIINREIPATIVYNFHLFFYSTKKSRVILN